MKNAEVEILVGAIRDVLFGPVILFGMGGVFAEVIGDRNIGLPPLNRTLARRLMEDTKAYKLLKGYRKICEADLALFELLLICLSHLLIDFPEISDLDMNPVLVKDGKPIVVDARIKIRRSEVSAPYHLVVSPYPEQYESVETTSKGIEIFIRPIKPEDAPLLVELFERLSSETRYHRFHSAMKSLSRDMLIRFTQIDYDRHIALVALNRLDGEEKIMGVVRAIIGPDRREAEVALTVEDSWQGKGVGEKLLQKCLNVCRDYGIGTVQSEVLSENHRMLNLGRKLGFTVAKGERTRTSKLRIDLQRKIQIN